MPDLEKLNNLIDDSGISKSFIAEKAGVSRQTLASRLDGTSKLTVDDMNALRKLLRLSAKECKDIFFS